MKKKIINILCHTWLNDKNLNYNIFGSLGSKLARQLSESSSDFLFESWLTVGNLEKKIVIRKDKVIYKVFPARTLAKMLESFFGFIQSKELFADLEKEDPKNTIIHFQGERGTLLYQLLYQYPQFKVVLQYHGYGQPFWLNWFEKVFFTPFEKKFFPQIKHFFVPIKPRREYLIKTIKINSKKISSENSGIDFSKFKPANKYLARKKLGLPKKAFILIYVGQLVAAKGVLKMIKAYKELKNKYSNLYLLFVGSNKSDPLYNLALKNADKIVGITNNDDLPVYYNASDLFCFYGSEKWIRFAGPGVAPSEALVCNLNVLSTNLFHFPDEIVDKIGLIPKNEKDFRKKIEFFINNPNFKFRPRLIVAPFTDSKLQVANLIKIYKEVFENQS